MGLSEKLNQVEKLSKGGRIGRFLHHPYKYLYAQLIARVVYRQTGILKKADTFFQDQMSLLLPASTDIYLTGGKTHESEIRLARFLLNTINSKDIIIDVGAHFGYFTLLFSKLAYAGHVYAFEPSRTNFDILSLNANRDNITIYNSAVSYKNEPLTFFEFPTLFSESNSLYTDQYLDEEWFKHTAYKEIIVDCVTLDNFCQKNALSPNFVKIDVEGAEKDVIHGARDIINRSSPAIAMEFVCPERKNANHHLAKDLLYSLGYKSYVIGEDGSLSVIEDINDYLLCKNLESDNIIFMSKPV